MLANAVLAILKALTCLTRDRLNGLPRLFIKLNALADHLRVDDDKQHDGNE